MKPLIITGDIAAITGIVAAIFHILPEIAGTITAILGIIWYSVLLYDRFKKKKTDPDA